ncbi:diaminopimelate decarboxylase [Buchnera aphidicola]|uniref:Diaminopimelate decarboxylase n=1 Tax=Buchnera aphidicola (Sarucallis kahawaluokalani) TaxID=1241878 RepID=A0A4D6YJB4_9GAMM|nr:diaminopimelate decarboxylase [Buchnera aphidicola]QCI26074.1 diaminopimelate decarboxylase [Buchnera aphidicola (Sarucallis kahawaluokalani)]
MKNFFEKTKLFNKNTILKILKEYSGPIWIYQDDIIKKKIHQLKKFDIIRFAQKSCSNIHILKRMRKLNIKIDAVSIGELTRALVAGFKPENDEIVFTSDIMNKETLQKIITNKITVNAGSLNMLEQLGKYSPGHRIWIRINPKFGHGHNQKTNTGGENSKHGIWNPELAIPIIKKYKLNLIGLHMHIGSGVDYIHLKKVCDAMVNQALYLNQDIQYISAGGGLSIPYKTTDIPINTENYFTLWNNARNIISKHFKHKIQLEIEPGRFLVGESGILITKIHEIKKVGQKIFTLIDAGFNDFMRPVLYGSYHDISIIPIDNRSLHTNKYIKTIIGGPLCESGDVFTQDENGKLLEIRLPEIKIGDYLIFHNTGAYGSSMSSNYNSRPLIPEILIKNNIPKIIRRRQTIEELLKLELEIK